MNKERLLKKYSAEKLADTVVEKDEEIKRLKTDLSNIKYIGSFYIEGKIYGFYIDEGGTNL